MDPDKTLVVLLAGGKGQRLEALTKERAKPAVPFGGIYRIIDFTLSNCLNSGLNKVLVLVQYRSRSLNRHIREGWSVLVNPGRGEFIEPLPPQQNKGDTWFQGTANAVYQSLFAIQEEDPESVLVLSGDHIYKMDYTGLVEEHLRTGADVTLGAVQVRKSEASGFGVCLTDERNRITRFIEKPQTPEEIPGEGDTCLASMGIYVFRPEVLYHLLDLDVADPKSSHDFGKDILPLLAGTKALYAYPFVDENRKEAHYWRDVGTIDAYYEANMDLINVDPLLNLYDDKWPIYTNKTMVPPPKFVFEELSTGRMGVAIDSIVASGCILAGGSVRRSVLSHSVKVHSYATVEGSILFENVDVGRHARIKNAIIDKDVRIPEGMSIGYDLEADRKRFTVSEKGIVVISKRAVL